MFSNCELLTNIKDTDKPINVYLSGGATHFSTNRTLNNIGEVYLHKNELKKNLSYAKLKDKHNITYDDMRDIFTVHTTYKRINSQGRKWGYIIITVNPTERIVTSRSCTLLNKTKKVSQIENPGRRKGKICIQYGGTSISSRF